MVERKTDGRPWQGPLTPPRVSPPRTFGDAIAAATYQRRSSSHRRPTRTSRPVGSPARSGPAGKKTNSNYFELPKFQDLDPLFPPLPRMMLRVSAACVTTGATEKSAQGFPGLAEHVVLGPGKIFRPTIGLRLFFRRTGTRVIHKHRVPPKTPPSPSTTPTRPSFAEVVREAKSMVAPGAGSGGDLGGRGGGRGAAFNPGFQPGFDPGFAGRGRDRDQFHPRGRGRGYGGQAGYGYNSSGPGYFGAGRGGRPQGEGYGGGRGRGGWNPRPRYQPAPMQGPINAGGQNTVAPTGPPTFDNPGRGPAHAAPNPASSS